MPIDAKVTGAKELGDEMVRLAEGMNMDIKKVVPIAAYHATKVGAIVCEPAQKLRQVITRSTPPRKKEINEGTDTSRTSTHWVKFYRQNKRPYFVPINPDPRGKAAADAGSGTRDHAKADSNRRKRAKPSTPSVLKYQRTRKSTLLDGKGTIKRYDTPAEIMAMRKIGRRGLAGEVWNSLGNKSGGGKKLGLKARDASGKLSGGRATKHNKEAIIKHSKKWGSLEKQESKTDVRITLENKLTYLQRRYPGAEGRIVTETAKTLENELKNRLIRRQKALEKQAKART